MLGLRYIQENKKSIINGIKKRGIDSSKIIEKIIDLDKKRKEKQTELDNHLANSNKIAKEIGTLFKTDETEKINSLKEKSINLKSLTKTYTFHNIFIFTMKSVFHWTTIRAFFHDNIIIIFC